MNEKKICFIMCVNNTQYMEECVYYIRNLAVPAGYEIDVLTILDAGSMTSGYSEGMKASDAKYKIYLHQDVFIVNTNLLADILKIFETDAVGMIGLVGNPILPHTAVMWNGARVGKLYTSYIYNSNSMIYGEFQGKITDVEAVDGFMMITQYDLPWREDLFKGWDFYDISQSQEFLRAGYRVVVPNQAEPWCIHDDGILNLDRYYEAREIFLREYKGKQFF